MAMYYFPEGGIKYEGETNKQKRNQLNKKTQTTEETRNAMFDQKSKGNK